MLENRRIYRDYLESRRTEGEYLGKEDGEEYLGNRE
jgi:hypothetical protein